ncbi:SDR family oxidoreductase [Marivivens sp. LCG002]|uniref:SDR family oxidoreductase n=1 Tax=Marivivens sp. LCG002 TaxID=3051171 RepID=UPI002556E4FE|nr:SDR family oxidoreductase [Marivivens sp. LCG002]WIV50660.1 SDR family oxidoreductase [Marivivens sp. LCG002]
MDMHEKVVLITGASRGIGEAAAFAFAEQGAKVVLAARSLEAIEGIAREIGERALAVRCDVARFDAVETAVARAVAAFGRLDVFISNAGVIEPMAQLAEADPEAFGRTIDINTKGVFHGMRAALPVMVKQGGGTIITVSSGAAYNAYPAWSAYCTSKAGALMLTKAAHGEYADRGIRALGLSPGTVATQMQRDIKASGLGPVAQLDWSDHIPPEWPARALVWMCGAEADAYLGQDVMLRDEAIRKKVGLV